MVVPCHWIRPWLAGSLVMRWNMARAPAGSRRAL